MSRRECGYLTCRPFISPGRRIREVLESAVRSGEARKDLDPDAMARHIVATIEGGIMVARASRDSTDLKECLTALSGIVGINPPESNVAQDHP